VPFKHAKTGRYVAAPSAKTIYATAGQWPQTPGDGFRLTQTLGVGAGAFVAGGAPPPPPATNGTYSAELWKSTDGGDTWAPLFTSEGEFYFNDVDCFDETHCVAVGEGYAPSPAPGARVYVTTDGATFTEAHRENATGAESLLAVKMLSRLEHWAGGTTATGAPLAPLLALHSTDGGATYANDHGGVRGQAITALDFPAPTRGYATSVNALQLSSLLEFPA